MCLITKSEKSTVKSLLEEKQIQGVTKVDMQKYVDMNAFNLGINTTGWPVVDENPK